MSSYISTIPSIDPTATTLAVIPSGEPTDYLSCPTIVIAIVHTYKYWYKICFMSYLILIVPYSHYISLNIEYVFP